MRVEEDPLEVDATAIADEALAPFEGLAPSELLAAIRAEIEDVLVATEDGRRLLRATRADPIAGRSRDVVVGGAVRANGGTERAAGGERDR
jgi:hypothetical protein